MKLTDEQLDTLRMLVDNEVTYYETYHEIYDHMVTAIESLDGVNDLQKAYADILEQDFDGHRGIEKLENEHRYKIWQRTSQKKRYIFYSFFKWPGILLPVALAAAYYIGFHYSIFRLFLFLGTIVVTILPFLVINIGNYFVRYKFKEAKASIKSVSINLMAKRIWMYVGWLWLFNLLLQIIPAGRLFTVQRSTSLVIGDIVTGTLFLSAFLYATSVLLVYRNELKERLA